MGFNEYCYLKVVITTPPEPKILKPILIRQIHTTTKFKVKFRENLPSATPGTEKGTLNPQTETGPDSNILEENSKTHNIGDSRKNPSIEKSWIEKDPIESSKVHTQKNGRDPEGEKCFRYSQVEKDLVPAQNVHGS